MTMGIILPSCIYDKYRVANAKKAFDALVKTDTAPFWIVPRLHLLLKMGVEFDYPIADLKKKFNVTVETDPAGVSGVEQTLAYGTTQLFKENVDYVTWIQDDTLVHPQWLVQLDKLIRRHPEAKAWSIYRSANVKTHKLIDVDANGDVLVQSIGHAMTLSKKEWREWNVPWQLIKDNSITMDLVHPCSRPGERWVTGVSWANHIGKQGVHMRPMIPEYAINFQGAE